MTWRVTAPGAASRPGTPSTDSPPAWRPPPARSARASATRSAWRWPPGVSAACSTRTPSLAPSPFDHFIYCFVSDGDIEEGISHEVSSLAAHHELGNLIVVYDDNRISIEDNTNIAKSEDVCARYEAYGWHVQRLSWRTPDGYKEDVPALYQALLTAKEHTEAPSFIALEHDHRLAGPEQAGHRRGARIRARRTRGEGDQGDPALRPRGRLPGRGRGAQPRAPGRGARQGAARGVGRAVRRLGER